MSRALHARPLWTALLVLFALPAHAGTLTIDLPTAMSRARSHAPEAVAAVGRIGEAQAAREGAGVRFVQNPQLQLGAGPRIGVGDARLVGQLTQQIGVTRRGPRIRAAAAGVAYARAAGDGELRDVGYAAAVAWCEARAAELDIDLVRRGEAIAVRALDSAQRRRRAGDVGDFDLELARASLGRARAAVAAAEAARAAAIGQLASMIGAAPGDTIALRGELVPAPLDLDLLRAGIPARADVRSLEAEMQLADAELTLAVANSRPDVGLWVGYEHEEDFHVIVGGVVVTLPLWNRAQGDQAGARARRRRSAAQRTAVLGAASRRVVDAFEAYRHAREAVAIFERDVVPSLVESERLLEQALDAGQIAVPAYLIGRREILDARHELLDRQLALALAAASARYVAGVTP